MLGTGEMASIVVIVCLTLFYTFEGGMTAVIWTDVIQMILYVGGALLSFYVILQQIPGGWGHVAEVGSAAAKFRFRFPFRADGRVLSGDLHLLGRGDRRVLPHDREPPVTEQLMVQRLLSARTKGESRAVALFSSWFVILFQFTLFLVIGVCLFVLYRDPGLAAPAVKDRIYPEFIWANLPHGLAGLVVAAILAAAMSNLSAALNSLASTTIMDFYKPLAEKSATSLIS